MSKKIFRFFNKQKEFEQDVLENGMRYSGFYGDSLRDALDPKLKS